MVRLLAWLHLTLGGAGLLAGSLFCIYAAREPNGGEALRYGAPLFLMLAVVYLLPAFLGGIGVLRGEGWARWVIAALSLLLLLVVPVGTLIGAFGLWALSRSPATARTAATPAQPAAAKTVAEPAKQPPPPGSRSAILWICAWVASGFVAMIGLGYRLHEDRAPPPIGDLFYPAIAVFLAATALGIARWPELGTPARLKVRRQRIRRQFEADIARFEIERRERIAQLEVDPTRRAYAARVAAGEYWNDAQIAYHQDPAALASCRHLQPIERAMREAGVEVRLTVADQLHAACWVNEPALRAQLSPARQVTYAQFYMGGRGGDEDAVAALHCEACGSAIRTEHPDARASAPWFPQQP